MKCFNGFCKAGVVHADTVNDILEMMGLRVKKEALDAIIAEVDEDGKKFDRVFIIINFGHLFTQTMKNHNIDLYLREIITYFIKILIKKQIDTPTHYLKNFQQQLVIVP